MGFSCTHDASDERFSAAAARSGGWLGGKENLLRSKGEYSRIFADPLFDFDLLLFAGSHMKPPIADY